MDFLILGQIEVRSASGAVALGGSKPRAVLAVLLLHANRPVSAERLALALWGEDAPGGAVKTVQVHVSRLRKALGDPEVITTSPAGYCLRVRDGELDAARFERLVEDARRALAAGEPADASATLREAVALWRGPALADLALEPFAHAESARLEEQRLAAIELRVEADLAAGRHAEVVGELAQLVADHPTREQLSGQLMLGLYRCGRQSDALEVYASARRVLVDELGVEPGPELRDLHGAILRQDVALQADAAAGELPPALDPAASQPLVGREDELAWLLGRWDSARTGAGGVVALIGPRGAGKSRLAQELARDVHGDGAAVAHASGAGPADTLLAALSRVRAATRPLLLVLDDVDRAGAGVRTELAGLALDCAPVLVVACAQDRLALTHVEAADTLELGALDAEAVRAIACRYAPGRPVEEVPAEWLLDASGGVARRVHEVAGQWARREAARHVGAVADRAVAGRAELRSIEAELTGGVVDLQETRERSRPRDDRARVVCPFKGLASYDVADAPYFFGRKRLVAELVTRLVGAPLLGVVGPSGSGKSSVMRAGLLPELAGGVLPGSEDWAQALLRPGAHPMRELGVALAGVPEGGRVVLAVDQFEETFTVCEDDAERDEFLAELVHAATGAGERYVVVLALRADHYGRCAAYPELARLLAASNVLVHPMLHDELLQAIEGPAEVAGLRIEPELADALVADVEREPGGLPLLSTALLELWQRRDGRRLRHAVYTQMGGVHGAVARLAESAYGELDEGHREIARDVLMGLVDAGEDDTVERRRVALTELETERDADVARVVALLTDRRLLTVSAGTVELAHEALLREWPRLAAWIDEDRDGLRIRRALSAAARDWDALGRDDGALYRGLRLAEAVGWRDAGSPSLSELERRFLADGEAAGARDRVTRRRRVVLALGSLTVALVAISIVAVASIVGGRSADSRALANRSRAVLAGDPALALSFGLDALRHRGTPEAEAAVRQATYEDRATGIIGESEKALYGSALTADGARLATGGEDGRVRVVDVARERVVATIRGPDAPAIDVAFSADDEQLAITYGDGSVATAAARGGPRHLVTRVSADGTIYARSVEYAPGRRLLLATNNDEVTLVGLDGSNPHALASHAGVRVVRLDPSGTRVLTAGDDGYARTWDLAGRQLKSMHHGAPIFDAAWSPKATKIVTVGGDGAARIWNARTGTAALKIALDLQALYSVRFNATGSRFVTGGSDGVVRVTSVDGGPAIAKLEGHRGIVFDAGFIRDNDRLFSDGADGSVRIWAPSATETLPAGPDSAAFGPNFNDDGSLVATGFIDGRVRLWNPSTGSLTSLRGFSSYAAAVFSSDGRYVLTSSGADAAVRRYDVGHPRTVVVPATKVPNYAAAIDSKGGRVALAGVGERVLVEAPDGSRLVRLAEHGQVDWIAFSPDGKHLATASEDATVRTWNATTGAAERTFHTPSAMQHVTYSPDGKRIAAAGTDGAIRTWTLGGGDPVVLYGHDGAVNAVAFDYAGDRLVSGGKDGTVRVWDPAGGDALVTLFQHVGEVTGVGFSPDGKRVVSGADDGVRISACDVCGAFAGVRKLASGRPLVALTDAARSRIGAEGG